MKKASLILISIFVLTASACNQTSTTASVSSDTMGAESSSYFTWNNATIYFLLTDRFNNGNTSNDFMSIQPRNLRQRFAGSWEETSKVLHKRSKMAISTVWVSMLFGPLLSTKTLKDLSMKVQGLPTLTTAIGQKIGQRLDPRITSEQDYAEFVETAHKHGIRVIMDVIVNHTGPVTPLDEKWPDSWVRTEPTCKYDNAPNTISMHPC